MSRGQGGERAAWLEPGVGVGVRKSNLCGLSRQGGTVGQLIAWLALVGGAAAWLEQEGVGEQAPPLEPHLGKVPGDAPVWDLAV